MKFSHVIKRISRFRRCFDKHSSREKTDDKSSLKNVGYREHEEKFAQDAIHKEN